MTSDSERNVLKDKGEFKSLTTQILGYFARPGDGGILREPLNVRAAWLGPNLAAKPEEWQTELKPEERKEVADAVKVAASTYRASGRSLASVKAEDVELPHTFVRLIQKLKSELSGVEGLGMHLVRGIPVEEWTPEEREFFFLAFGRRIGVVGEQDSDGLVIQHVRSTGADYSKDRAYKTNDEIEAHCDPSDVVGLLCLEQGLKGGLSRIVSSVSVYNEFLSRHPDMVERLYGTFPLDLKGNNRGPNYWPITPVRYSSTGQLRTFWTMDHFISAYRHPDAPNGGTMPAYDARVIDAFNNIISDKNVYLDMQFQKGDIQLLSNHTIFHARTAFEDGAGKQRDLLRLWLSLGNQKHDNCSEGCSRTADLVKIIVSLAWGILRQSIWFGKKEVASSKSK